MCGYNGWMDERIIIPICQNHLYLVAMNTLRFFKKCTIDTFISYIPWQLAQLGAHMLVDFVFMRDGQSVAYVLMTTHMHNCNDTVII